jgi:hypothetical protein
LYSEAELADLELKISELRTLQKELNDRRNVRLSLPKVPLSPPTSPSNIISASQLPPTGKEFTEIEDIIDYRLQKYSFTS